MQDREQPVLSVVSDNALEGHLGEAAVDLAVTKIDFIFHGRTGADHGVDETIEVTRADEPPNAPQTYWRKRAENVAAAPAAAALAPVLEVGDNIGRA